jgi:hypothetical protein
MHTKEPGKAAKQQHLVTLSVQQGSVADLHSPKLQFTVTTKGD